MWKLELMWTSERQTENLRPWCSNHQHTWCITPAEFRQKKEVTELQKWKDWGLFRPHVCQGSYALTWSMNKLYSQETFWLKWIFEATFAEKGTCMNPSFPLEEPGLILQFTELQQNIKLYVV